MSGGTGENEQGLRKVLDFTRLAAIFILLLHFYYHCYGLFRHWKLTSAISDRLLINIQNSGLFNHVYTSKSLALLLLIISLVGAKGKKTENLNLRLILIGLFSGIALYFSSGIILNFPAPHKSLECCT